MSNFVAAQYSDVLENRFVSNRCKEDMLRKRALVAKDVGNILGGQVAPRVIGELCWELKYHKLVDRSRDGKSIHCSEHIIIQRHSSRICEYNNAT